MLELGLCTSHFWALSVWTPEAAGPGPRLLPVCPCLSGTRLTSFLDWLVNLACSFPALGYPLCPLRDASHSASTPARGSPRGARPQSPKAQRSHPFPCVSPALGRWMLPAVCLCDTQFSGSQTPVFISHLEGLAPRGFCFSRSG